MKPWLLLATAVAAPAAAQTTPADAASIAAQLQELRAMRDSMAKQMNDFDQRIDALEAQLRASQSAAQSAGQSAGQSAAQSMAPTAAAPEAVAAAPAAPASAVTDTAAQATTALASTPAPAAGDAPSLLKPGTWGSQEPGKGFVLARADRGELGVNLVTYFRYLDQTNLQPTYTNYFGETKTLKLSNDFQLNKVTLTFKGWVIDERLRWLVFLWTNNANQGESGSIAVGGHLSYRFADWLTLGGGIDTLPTTRSTTGNYPNWLRNDNRTMADEYFRGSFTTGVWLDGKFDRFQYRVMVGNNLSTLGVSASQLFPGLNTASVYLRWMPTTGEFGPVAGFGDYEYHEELATLFEAHYTYSREDAQEQPNTNAVENSQIRLSDGGLLFAPGVFGTQYRIKEATYQMAAFDAALKYRGYSLEAEGYVRWLDDFLTTVPLPYESLFDTGLNVQASAMLAQKKLQAYATFSQIWGEFGNPTEAAFGLNWYPFGVKNFRITPNALWLQKSPVGYNGVPYVVGGQGWVFYLDIALGGF
jgi:hypothetical protein